MQRLVFWVSFRTPTKSSVRMIRYEMVLGIDLIDCLDCLDYLLASYDEGLSGDI